MTTVISVQHLSKTYRLGQIGTGRFRQAQPNAFTNDLKLWWQRCAAPGGHNPLLRIGEKDHGNRNGEELWTLRDVSFTVNGLCYIVSASLMVAIIGSIFFNRVEQKFMDTVQMI